MTDVRQGPPWEPPRQPGWPAPTYGAPAPSGPAYGGGPGYEPARPVDKPAGPARATALVALVASLIGGLIGAGATVVAVRNSDIENVLDPEAKLGAGTVPVIAPDATPVAAVAAKLLPSVVSIEVAGAEGRGTGSGVVLRSDGYIITNNHVVEGASEIEVIHASGDRVAADLVGGDPDTDIAVIKARVRGLPPATLGKSTTLHVGDPVVAVGSPLGLTGTVTSGIVSALNRRGITNGTVFSNFIQTDAAINPGNSGGALANLQGQVVGINSAIATTGGGSIGLGFAIPIDEARSVAEEIIRTGRATHPYIGVSARTIDPETSRQLSLPVGAQIMQLVAGGPAQTAGLKVQDIITAIAGAKVTSVDDLVVNIRQHKIGETVSVTYIRGGRTAEAKVVLAEKPAG